MDGLDQPLSSMPLRCTKSCRMTEATEASRFPATNDPPPPLFPSLSCPFLSQGMPVDLSTVVLIEKCQGETQGYTKCGASCYSSLCLLPNPPFSHVPAAIPLPSEPHAPWVP